MQLQNDWNGTDSTPNTITQAYVTYNGNATAYIKANDVSELVPPNESRSWHLWYSLIKPLNVTEKSAQGMQISETGKFTCPLDSTVTKSFQINGLQQYVYQHTGKGSNPATITPGIPGTPLAWTVYDIARVIRLISPPPT